MSSTEPAATKPDSKPAEKEKPAVAAQKPEPDQKETPAKEAKQKGEKRKAEPGKKTTREESETVTGALFPPFSLSTIVIITSLDLYVQFLSISLYKCIFC